MADVTEKETPKAFISAKEMKEKYPKGEFRIVGEYVAHKTVPDDEGFEILTVNGFKRVRNAGYYKRFNYKAKAYEYVNDDDDYIAVLKRNWITLIVSLGLIILLLLGGYWLWHSRQGPDIDPAIADYVSELKRPKDLDKSQIAVPGITSIVMDADTDRIKGDILINPKGNPCYFKYSIVLKDTKEVLYESKLVPPGKGISEVKLNRKMTQGNYKITLRIHTYDLKEYDTELNGAEIDSELRVLK